MSLLWAEFIALAGVIVYAGTHISRYGDVIAEKTGLGRTWIGVLPIAMITSMPETFNGISSVTVAGVPDIAVGDVMGSLIFNLSLFALMDVIHGRKPIFTDANPGHMLSAGLGTALVGIIVVSRLAGGAVPAIGHMGLYTPVIIIVYLAGLRVIFAHERKRASVSTGDPARLYDHMTLREAALKFSLYSALIITAATLLPFLGDRIAASTGLGRTFIGTFLIGATTSLPELVVSIASVRIGAVDMAIANIFGSNMYDVVIVAIDDVFYTRGPILMDVTMTHAFTGLMAMAMTAAAMLGLACRARRKTFLRAGWDSISIAVLYLASISVMYLLRGTG